ncbi:hypothetical protein [Rheinheimera sp.]|uniref:hypothetical protein n=1 Tax=Rheinheimera sp. TaxID=1869214 RepID=UPI00307EC196
MTDKELSEALQLEWQQQVLICRIQGAWTQAVTTELIRQVQQQVQAFGGKPWVRVMDMQHWALATPDALAQMQQFIGWEDQHACVLRCFVGLNEVQQQLLDFKYDSSHKPLYFGHIDTATSYARQLLQQRGRSGLISGDKEYQDES